MSLAFIPKRRSGGSWGTCGGARGSCPLGHSGHPLNTIKGLYTTYFWKTNWSTLFINKWIMYRFTISKIEGVQFPFNKYDLPEVYI